jgi:ubiquinone/menaquinone biosynthesis C-methylase UbiE
METFVVPRYLSLFGQAALEMFLTSGTAAIAHLGCRTGYPDKQFAERLSGGSIVGVDSSSAAIELARTKAALISEIHAEYSVGEGYPSALPPRSFTHGVSLHPAVQVEGRHALLSEMARLIMPRGQLLLAMPMRGSFQELFDLFREFALKYDAAEMGKAIEVALLSRPTVETLTQEIEDAGFENVDVDLNPVSLEFQSGRGFLEDPITRLLVLPEFAPVLATGKDAPLKYVQEAIDRYWAEQHFELAVTIGCASGRRAM